MTQRDGPGTAVWAIIIVILTALGVLFYSAMGGQFDGVDLALHGPTATPRPTLPPLPTATPIDWSMADKPSYGDFFRYAEKYEGKPVTFYGEVLQIIDDCYRVAVEQKGTYWDVDSAILACGSSNVRIMEEDMIFVAGLGAGIERYTTVMGAEREIPAVRALSIVAR